MLSMLDLSYVDDFLPKSEALKILKDSWETRQTRIDELKEKGYPAYTTAIGWAGYSDETVIKKCREAIEIQGFEAFKVKVGTG